MEFLGHAFAGPHVDAGLQRQHHARVQDAARAVLDEFVGQRVLALAHLAHLRGFDIAAAVVHVHAQPVAGAVHVELEVGARVDHVVDAADLVAVEQAQVEHALRQHLHGRVVRVVEAVAGLGGGGRGVLAGQHQVVQRALRAAELAVGREGAGDVAGVAVEFATGVDQHQLALAHGRGVGAVVQHAGVGAGRDDGAVGRVLRAAQAELVQQLGIEVVLAHVLALAQHARRQLHRADVGAGADLRGAAHDVLLVRVLHEAHLVERAAQVALLLGAQRAVAHARAHRLQPAVDAGFQALVGGEGEPHGRAVLEQLRQLGVEVVHREGLVHAQRGGGGVGAEAVAVPDLAFQVFRRAEQRGAAVARQHQPGVGLGETGQVVEVAVVAEQEVAVAVALALGRGGNDGDAVLAQLRSEARAALGVDRGVIEHGISLSIRCKSGVRGYQMPPWEHILCKVADVAADR
ncbi:hypothetical protein D3C71_779570 [compost metagenome]